MKYHNISVFCNFERTVYSSVNFCFREGRNQYEKAFGVSSKDLFEALYR